MPDARKLRLRKIKPTIFERDGYRCVYCNGTAVVLDHVVSRYHGGTDDQANLVAACSECNSRKGWKSLAELGWADPR